jgi:hypothetical protein
LYAVESSQGELFNRFLSFPLCNACAGGAVMHFLSSQQTYLTHILDFPTFSSLAKPSVWSKEPAFYAVKWSWLDWSLWISWTCQLHGLSSSHRMKPAWKVFLTNTLELHTGSSLACIPSGP